MGDKIGSNATKVSSPYLFVCNFAKKILLLRPFAACFNQFDNTATLRLPSWMT